MKQWILGALLTLACFSLLGCKAKEEGQKSTKKQILRIAVTTSTRDSGLLKKLLPVFEKDQNAEVQVLAVGTGKALKLGEMGEVDAVVVHAKKSEEAFMKAGFGSRRVDVMVNYFVIVGPKNDPAKIEGLSVSESLPKIQNGNFKFISRGDNSGTHKKEISLWGGSAPKWDNYIKSGQGMGATLIMADQMNAYTLADIGTYLKMIEKLALKRLNKKEPKLLNPYGAMVVNPVKHPKAKAKLAGQFLDFLISEKAQRMIGEYKINNKTLFEPLHLNKKN
ncbi:MAG: extracellular solute-binding protein [Planctomycetota bacterium]|nr:extracellular solute-binding protein [Planctomycetota bacterium]